MRKIMVLLLSLIVILVGCGSNEESVRGSVKKQYNSVNGVIAYEENPKIYTDYFTGGLLYLGANIIGSDLTYRASSWEAIAKERGVVDTGENMEQVAILEPELIITIYPEKYEQYSSIAPTIVLEYEKYTPEEMIAELGKIIGCEEEASAWQVEFDRDVEELQALIDNPENTVSIVEAWGDSIYMYGANYGRGGYILYEKLGIKGTPQGERDYIRKKASYLQVDGESIINYIGDVMLIADNGNGGEAPIKKLPTYNELKATQKGNVILMDGMSIYSDPYSLKQQIEILKGIYESKKL